MNHIRQITEPTPRLTQIHALGFDYGWNDSMFLESLQNTSHICLGAWSGDTLQAFVISAKIGDEAEIQTLATDPAARRQGHARALMQQLIKTLRDSGTTRLFLEVAVDNTAAVALYRDLGFDSVGLRKAYYSRKSGPPLDAHILSLALSDG